MEECRVRKREMERRSGGNWTKNTIENCIFLDRFFSRPFMADGRGLHEVAGAGGREEGCRPSLPVHRAHTTVQIKWHLA